MELSKTQQLHKAGAITVTALKQAIYHQRYFVSLTSKSKSALSGDTKPSI